MWKVSNKPVLQRIAEARSLQAHLMSEHMENEASKRKYLVRKFRRVYYSIMLLHAIKLIPLLVLHVIRYLKHQLSITASHQIGLSKHKP